MQRDMMRVQVSESGAAVQLACIDLRLEISQAMQSVQQSQIHSVLQILNTFISSFACIRSLQHNVGILQLGK